MNINEPVFHHQSGGVITVGGAINLAQTEIVSKVCLYYEKNLSSAIHAEN